MISSILFVCTGNICRSPTAEGVFRHYYPNLILDSAGINDYHAGDAPDPRALKHAKKRGYDLSDLRAREIIKADFEIFDLIYAMDESHVGELEYLCPNEHFHKVKLMLHDLGHPNLTEVPDPYYGSSADFERVLDSVEWAAEKWRNRGLS